MNNDFDKELVDKGMLKNKEHKGIAIPNHYIPDFPKRSVNPPFYIDYSGTLHLCCVTTSRTHFSDSNSVSNNYFFVVYLSNS